MALGLVQNTKREDSSSQRIDFGCGLHIPRACFLSRHVCFTSWITPAFVRATLTDKDTFDWLVSERMV
jgi:hypothetical protein